MKKVLLIGADGMLGGELRERLEKNYEVYGTTLATLDITDREAVLAKAKEVNPYFIINCAAYTNVDGCETNEDLALAVNGTALDNIAEAAKQEDATLIHISTDYVFPGNLPIDQIYTEDMEPAPVSAYGRTKLVGERNAAKAEKYYILRTAWLYGLGGKNFVKTMLRLSKDHDVLTVVNDQHGSPTSTTTLCSIIEQVMEKEPAYGVYHSTNEGFTTWYEFTKKIFEIAGIKTEVKPITSKEYKEMYPQSSDRPANSQLSKEKLHSVGIYPENYEEALKKYLAEELKNFE
jgi:dTDP-4-dehydrorhamnose reductase